MCPPIMHGTGLFKKKSVILSTSKYRYFRGRGLDLVFASVQNLETKPVLSSIFSVFKTVTEPFQKLLVNSLVLNRTVKDLQYPKQRFP